MTRIFEPPELPDKPPPKPLKPVVTVITGQPADTGRVLPIVYGTCRVTGVAIERYAYTFASTAAQQRAASTGYLLGDIRGNFGNLFLCVVPGTSGTGDGPSGTGSGQVDGGVTWDYVAMGYRHFVAIAFCEGQIFGAGKGWQDKNVFAAYTSIPHDSFWLNLMLGTPSGGRPTLPAWFQSQTDVYGNTVVLYGALSTGSDADLPTTELEIKGIFTDGTHSDANPADIAIDLLTHARRGAQWPAARVDAVSTGSGAASWRTYATAYGFNLSWSIDSQRSAKALLQQLLEATNTEATMTNRLDGLGWMVKFVPLCDVGLTANGVTFTPNITPAYSLTLDDLLDNIEIDSVAPTDTYNDFPIEFISRARDYAVDSVEDPDMSDVDGRGLVRASTTSVGMVMDPAIAIQLSRIKAQRSLNVRNRYRFNLPYRFLLVEPTDVLSVTDSLLGLTATRRVTAFEEDQSGDGLIKIEAEDFPSGVGAAASYTPQVGDGFKPTVSKALATYNVLPGQAPASVVPDSTSTRGGAVGNLFPNPISETSPPDGVNTTTAEWAGRTNAVAAYTGSFTRTPGLGASLAINYDVPAAPNETYYFEAQVKATAAAANKGGFLKIEAFDKTGASLGSASSTENDTTSFARLLTSFLMPANTVRVRFSLNNGTDAAAQAYFDVIYARKAINAGLIEPGSILIGHTSLGQYNTLNFWPNPTSEIAPPASYTPPGDGSDPEFDFRFSSGAAYNGTFVRRLIRTTAGTTTLDLVIPVLDSGDLFAMYWYHKFISSAGTPTVTVRIQHLDASKAQIGEQITTLSTADVTWTQGNVRGSTTTNQGGVGAPTPAGAVYTRFRFQLVTAASGTCEVHFDWLACLELISGKRIQDGSVATPNLGDLQVTTAKLADGSVTSVKLDATAPGLIDNVAAKTDADQVDTVGVATNITNMSFAVAANGIYEWEAFGPISTAGTSAGLQMSVTGPASPTAVTWTWQGWNNSTQYFGTNTAFGTNGSLYQLGAGMAAMRGTLVNGANAGTVQLQFAWNAVGTSATAKKGWFLRWRKIG